MGDEVKLLNLIKAHVRYQDAVVRAAVNRIVEIKQRHDNGTITQRDREEIAFLSLVLQPAIEKMSESWNNIVLAGSN